jgi:secretion/DNA translocation related TadE-like protein
MDGSFAQAGASVTEGDGFARGQRGSGTVLAVGLVAAIASTLLALAAICGAAVARLSAVAAADLAALAGAQALIDGQGIESACLAARVVAEASGAELLACRATAPDRLAATCQVPVELPLLGARVASAQAEAGPP